MFQDGSGNTSVRVVRIDNGQLYCPPFVIADDEMSLTVNDNTYNDVSIVLHTTEVSFVFFYKHVQSRSGVKKCTVFLGGRINSPSRGTRCILSDEILKVLKV